MYILFFIACLSPLASRPATRERERDTHARSRGGSGGGGGGGGGESTTTRRRPTMQFGLFTKLFLWLRGIVFLITWREKKGFSKAPDAADFTPADGDAASRSPADERTVVFIRHGESDWNEIFNKEKYMLLPRLFLGCLKEWGRCCHASNSVFLDSPLSEEGCGQAEELERYLTKTGDPARSRSVKVVREGNQENSIIVASNLRRAIHTGLLALWPRLQANGDEKITLLACLQEMSRNVDTNSITEPNAMPETGVVARRLNGNPAKWLDHSKNTGNKKMCKSALPRFERFCDFCFEQAPGTAVVVGAGHSLWFQNFFKLYLPKALEHDAKSFKMYNCAAVSLTLCRGKNRHGQRGYYVRASSISPDYLGFKKKKKKKGLMKKLGALAVLVVLAAVLAQFFLGGDDEGVAATTTTTSAEMLRSGCMWTALLMRVGGVTGTVASLVGAGMYVCTGENKPAANLGVVAFYSFLIYLVAHVLPSVC